MTSRSPKRERPLDPTDDQDNNQHGHRGPRPSRLSATERGWGAMRARFGPRCPTFAHVCAVSRPVATLGQGPQGRAWPQMGQRGVHAQQRGHQAADPLAHPPAAGAGSTAAGRLDHVTRIHSNSNMGEGCAGRRQDGPSDSCPSPRRLGKRRQLLLACRPVS